MGIRSPVTSALAPGLFFGARAPTTLPALPVGWQISQLSRHPLRPYTLDYAEKIFDEFHELHGDRAFADDHAIVRRGICALLATEPETSHDRYTGKITGVPCFQDGKVTWLESWLAEHGQTLQDSWFYSDSHNDLPLLNRVTRPVAVDPDDILRQHAVEHDWRIMSLRD